MFITRNRACKIYRPTDSFNLITTESVDLRVLLYQGITLKLKNFVESYNNKINKLVEQCL